MVKKKNDKLLCDNILRFIKISKCLPRYTPHVKTHSGKSVL